MYKQLNINNYRTYFILGNNEDEKTAKREVIINISLRFLRNNASCSSDNLKDTVCYGGLLAFLDSKLHDSQFNLVEKAAQFVYDTICEYVKNDEIQIRIELIKENPPVKGLSSASFIISDW